ncbi:MAG: hypothetical protein JWP18_133 [Solirubrobacterales bacterium]|nr:hypothetical protein [Solirubrobacterales bacterium]
MKPTVTYVGAATLLLEIGGLRLLTDPALDPAGSEYAVEVAPGVTIASRKLLDPALTAAELGHIDAVLLSHDEHFDNLDDAGRRLLRDVDVVLTTPSGAERIEGAVGLERWASIWIGPVRVTAVPARHGPEGTEAVIGHTTGFVLEWEAQPDGALYISGDTVWFDDLLEIADRFDIATAIIHLGDGSFEAAGDMRFTLDATAGARLADALKAGKVIPLHYEGWAHFTQPADVARTVLDDLLGDRVLWLEAGTPTDV